MLTHGPYEPAWRRYRIRRWAVLVWVMAMVGVSCFRLEPSRDTTMGQVFWSIAFAVLVALIIRWRTWPCPRCGHSFLPARFGKYGPNRCTHCGLPLWSSADPDPGAPFPRWWPAGAV